METYAFFDSGSNTSFCTESLLRQLNVEGSKTKLSLTTLQGNNEPADCSVVTLEVFDLNQENCVELPAVYSRADLSIRLEAIAKQEDVDRWSHLNGIEIPHIDADIGLLIRSDVPQALQPNEFRASENGGPFATRTVLGWVLNGPLGRDHQKIPTANYMQAKPTLDQQFQDYCNREFNDYIKDSKAYMSPNDQKALDIMNDSVKLINGHYEIALPWKNYPPLLQNNKQTTSRDNPR